LLSYRQHAILCRRKPRRRWGHKGGRDGRGRRAGQQYVQAAPGKSWLWTARGWHSVAVLSHIISQLRPGADLSRVTLPTFILEPRSMLERITKW